MRRDNSRLRRLQRTDDPLSYVRLQFPDLFSGQPFEWYVEFLLLKQLRPLMEVLEIRDLVLVGGENEFTRLAEGDAVLFAARVEEVAPSDTESSLERVGRVVDASVG